MIERYINKLLKQYQAAINNQNFSLDSSLNKEEFYHYLIELRNRIEIYKNLLEHTSIKDDNIGIELNKGVYDTVTTPFDDKKTILITPYAKTFDVVGNRFIYKGNVNPFDVDLNGITIKQGRSSKLTIPFYDYIHMTNPYDQREVTNFNYLSLYNKVCLGMYGSIHDKDYNKKIKKLGEVNDYINGKLEVARVKETYVGVSVSQNPKIYRKTR